MIKKNKENPFLSTTFKLWLVGIIFLLRLIHLYCSLYQPDCTIIPSDILLGSVLFLIGYLWMQELRDKHRLKLNNIALSDAQKQLEGAEINAIAALILTEEAKDPYTRGHSKRVTRCAMAIAEEMNLSEEFQKMIERAGMLHDVGKIGISDAILNKTEKLTDEEWAFIKRHPQIGVELLGPLKFLQEEKEIIYHHHERIDGKGYPDGMKGDDIPLGSKILAVADTFDAMNSVRSYRKRLPENEILAELERVADTQLDAEIVKLFIDLLKKKPSLWSSD